MPTRREALRFCGVAVVGLAGCPGDAGRTTDLAGHVRPDSDPQTVPDELACDREAFERRRGWISETELQWGNLTTGSEPAFALRVECLSVERGESVTVTLTNVSGDEQNTGNVHKANLDVYTEAGWQDPRGWPDGQPKPITDDLWEWKPGEQYEVTFKMTSEGVVEGAFHAHTESLVTCPGLPAGRYRYATAAPQQGDVAVAFDLLDK